MHSMFDKLSNGGAIVVVQAMRSHILDAEGSDSEFVRGALVGIGAASSVVALLGVLASTRDSDNSARVTHHAGRASTL